MGEFFADNYVMIYELFGILIMLVISIYISKKMRAITVIAVALIALETVFFYLERWTQTFETLSLARPMLTSAIYSLYPLILFCLFQITLVKKHDWRFYLVLSLPSLVCIPLYFTSQWSHLVFHFSEDNHYGGGPLAHLPYFIFGLYVLLFFVGSLLYFKDYGWKNRLIAAFIVLGPAIGAILYLIFDAGKDYSSLFVSAILLYYIFLYVHSARIDPLTGLLNRQSYYKALRSKSITGIVSVDMNDLKYINDNDGHEAGDTSLKTVSSVMKWNCGRGGVTYRVGGDEFMIVYHGLGEETIVRYIGQMKEAMAKTPYICAFGYAIKENGQSIKDVVRESDKRMYEEKNAIKHAGPKTPGNR